MRSIQPVCQFICELGQQPVGIARREQSHSRHAHGTGIIGWCMVVQHTRAASKPRHRYYRMKGTACEWIACTAYYSVCCSPAVLDAPRARSSRTTSA